MTATDALRALITPLVPGWKFQYGRWLDGLKTERYAVLRPMGGMSVSLVRRPQFTLTLIGAATDAADVPERFAQAVIAAMNASAGGLVFMQPAEPVYWATNDGRAVAELSISTITNNT